MNRDEQFDTNLELARRVFLDMLDRDPKTWPESQDLIVFLPIRAPELAQVNQAALGEWMVKNPGGTVETLDYIVGRPPVVTDEDQEPASDAEGSAPHRHAL